MASEAPLPLFDLVKPELVDGSRMFASRSMLVAVSDQHSTSQQVEDIDITVRLLLVLKKKLLEAPCHA